MSPMWFSERSQWLVLLFPRLESLIAPRCYFPRLPVLHLVALSALPAARLTVSRLPVVSLLRLPAASVSLAGVLRPRLLHPPITHISRLPAARVSLAPILNLTVAALKRLRLRTPLSAWSFPSVISASSA